MLRRAVDILMILVVVAVITLLWRGRMVGTPSAEALERLRAARKELEHIQMLDEVGGAAITPSFIDWECAVSAKAAMAAYDLATNQTERAAALKGHLRRMNYRLAALRSTIWEETYPVEPFRRAQRNVALAQFWVQFLGN